METQVIIRPERNGYVAACLTDSPEYPYNRLASKWGTSPRQALQRLANVANLHGETVRVEVTAPCKARLALRQAFQAI
jgi:hypothetical protein